MQFASMGALLLKKKYLDKKETISRLSQDKLGIIASTVSNMMTPQRSLMFLKRCCEILVRICNHVVKCVSIQKAEKEFLNIIQTMSAAQALNMKLALMYLIEISCEGGFNDATLLSFSSELISIFNRGLGDPSNEVQVANFKSLTIFLSTIREESSMKQFSPLLKNILSKAIELIKFDQ